MLNQDEIDNQFTLLATYRRTLMHLLQQAAQFGGEPFAPPQTINGIYEARVSIARCKDILHGWGVQVEDHPNDEDVKASKSESQLARSQNFGISFDPNNNPITIGLSANHPLQVFLCHSAIDKPVVRNLYQRLKSEGIKPWLDEEDILPGQEWQQEIPKAVRTAHAVIVCLSRRSITKAGYIQKEIKYAIDVAEEQPEGAVFLIPLRLEDCEVPERLRRWQWVDLFEQNGYERLIRALRSRIRAIDIALPTPGSLPEINDAQQKGLSLEQTATTALPQLDSTPSSKDINLIAAVRPSLIPSPLSPLATSPVINDLRPIPPHAPQFYISTYPVTNRWYKAFLDDPVNHIWRPGEVAQLEDKVDDRYLLHWTNGAFPHQLADHPLINVSWNAAQAYLSWLGNKLNLDLRLPKHTEWELAAQAGRSSLTWREEALREEGFNCNKTVGRLTAVGAFDPNPYGLYDITGNVYELCLPESTAQREERGRSADQVMAYGGAFYVAPAEVMEPLPLLHYACRPDVGFRYVCDDYLQQENE